MITAAEARQLVETSAAVVDKYVNAFEQQIRQHCQQGTRFVRASQVLTTTADYEKFSGSLGPFDQLKETPLQSAVIKEFIKLGYGAKMEIYGDKYVPRGLADDDGHGPEHQNYSLTIRW